MRQLLTFFFTSLLAINVSGQEFSEAPQVMDEDSNQRLSQHRYYSTGVNGEEFLNGGVNYQISKKLRIQLEVFYAKFGTHEQFTPSLVLKRGFNEKGYFFAGTESEYDINQVTGKFELVRVNLNVGLGYEVKPDLLLELGYHPEISSPKVDPFGRPLRKQNSFSLRAQF